MKIIIKQTSYKHDGYDKSIVGSLTKKDKESYVELMTKKDIAIKVAEKNNISVRDIQKKYSHLIDQKFDQIIDRYITAWISNKAFNLLHSNPLNNPWEETPKAMLIRGYNLKEGGGVIVDDNNMVLLKDFSKVLYNAKKRIKHKGSQEVFVGNPTIKDYKLVGNKEMLRVHRIVQKRMNKIDNITIEYQSLDDKTTSYNLHIRSYPQPPYMDRFNDSWIVHPDYTIGSKVKRKIESKSINPIGSFGFRKNEETGKYHMYKP